jgi:hypothetical protein
MANIRGPLNKRFEAHQEGDIVVIHLQERIGGPGSKAGPASPPDPPQ